MKLNRMLVIMVLLLIVVQREALADNIRSTEPSSEGIVREINVETLNSLNKKYDLVKETQDIHFGDDGRVIVIKFPQIDNYFKINYAKTDLKDVLSETELIEKEIEAYILKNKASTIIFILTVILVLFFGLIGVFGPSSDWEYIMVSIFIALIGMTLLSLIDLNIVKII